MYRATAVLKGMAPLSQSRKHDEPFLEGESHEAYEERTWRSKGNYGDDGEIFVPAMAFKQAMDYAAKRLAIKDPDNRRAQLTKFFVSDVICEGHMKIGVHRDSMSKITINANADGVRGSGKRVRRSFPVTSAWKGEVSFLIMDEKITPDVFEKVLRSAGQSVGVGQFRPQNGGLNGRFEVVKITYDKV